MPNSGDFGSQLRKLRPDWWQFNLNYDELNKRLVEVKREFGLRKALSSRSLTGETRTFAEILDQDVEKIVMFYLRAQGDLATRLWELRQKQMQNLEGFSLSTDQIEGMCQKYRDLGQDVLDLLEYLDLNVLGLRKIIKKHDKQFDLQMGTMYFGSRMGQNSQLVQLYHQEGLCAIIGTIRRGFEDLYEAKQTLLFGDGMQGADYGDDLHSRRSYYFGPSSGQGVMGRSLGSPHRRAIPKTSYSSRRASSNSLLSMGMGRGQAQDRKQALGYDGGGAGGLSGSHSGGYQTLRGGVQRSPRASPGGIGRSISSSFLSLLAPQRRQSDASVQMNSSMSNLEPVLLKISEASDRVMKNQKESAGEYMAVHSIMGLEMAVRDMDRSDEEDSEDETVQKKSKKRVPRVTSSAGLFLSLFVTFLYQMNQYVVAPTSGLYSDKLGMSAGLSGLIIGLSPLAALVSAMIYSVWTNYSFKQPLVISLVFLVAGNLFYAIALQCESPRFIFVGRLLTGLGGPRGITRRYIADHVSLADRTEASSYFVTAGAMGLACGPLMSSLVSASGYSFVMRWNNVIIVQYELVTAPGWIMFTFFAFTLFAVIFTFRDPIIAKPKASSRGMADKKKGMRGNPLSYLLAPFQYFYSGSKSSDGSSANLSDGRAGQGRYGAIPVKEQVVCVELGDVLERGDNVDSDDEDYGELRGDVDFRSSFSCSRTPLEATQEVDENSSEPGTPERISLEIRNEGAGEREGSPISGTHSPRGTSSSAASLSKALSPAPYSALKLRRESSRSNDLNDNISSHSNSSGNMNTNMNMNNSSGNIKSMGSIGTSRSTSRKSSVETMESGKDTLSALDVRTAGKRATPSSSSSSSSLRAAEDACGLDEGNALQSYGTETPPAVEFPGKFSLPGLGSMYTYNYSERNFVEEGDDSCWLCCNLFGAEVAVILFIYLINKTGQEMIVSSVPCLSSEIFGWDSQRAGFFMATMGALVLPFNILISKLAKDMEDRAMMVNLNYLSFGSLIFLLHTRIIEYSSTQYICGSILIFVFLNALEGVIMSLLSKLVSPELAKGTFNSGLLATEAGTLGRVIGDMAITGFSVGNSGTKLMNILFSPVAAGIIICIILSARYFDRMAV